MSFPSNLQFPAKFYLKGLNLVIHLYYRLAKDRLHKLGSRLDKRIPDLVGMGAAISFASGLTERMEWAEKSSYRATGFEPDC